MVANATLISAHRFGLGPKPGELSRIDLDPRQWLDRQLELPMGPGPAFTAARTIMDTQVQARTAQQQKNQDALEQLQRQSRGSNARDLTARFSFAAETDRPFVERLVHFWSNHFAISVDKPTTQGMGGSFEAEAIRPQVLGRFEDMLIASTRHPGMLLYLDNAQSVGPHSQAGQRSGRGLNENLAREIMELHTLGVDGGYDQTDVTNFAKVITGWTVPRGPIASRLASAKSTYVFVEQLHEPGSQKILGKTYRQSGEDQGLAVLKDLAAHPHTARHIAFKLARHFVADEPPTEVVDRLAAVYLESDGDLPSLYRALLDEPQAWGSEPLKYRTPNEWLLSIYRATNQQPLRPPQWRAVLVNLGQLTWQPGSPAGWPDTANYWDSPDALGKRIEWADAFAQRATGDLSAQRLLEVMFADAANPDLVKAVSRAESNSQALVLAMMSPALLRR
jgi:uncharacterized protein (DUF1800 family)